MNPQPTLATFAQYVVDALPINVCVVDEGGFVVAANDAWCRFAKLNRGDPSGYVGASYFKALDPVPDIAAGIQSVLAGYQSTYFHEYPCFSPENPDRWFRMHVARFEHDDGIYLVISHEEITELRRARAALESLQGK